MNRTYDTQFATREFSNAQLIDLGDRVVDVLDDETLGFPANDFTALDVLADFSWTVEELAKRLDKTRSSPFTRKLNAQDEKRDDFVRALRRGVKYILQDPDPEVPAEKREAADFILARLNERKAGFEKMSDGENSSELKFLFKDLDAEAGQAALTTTDLMRYYTLLKTAQDDFIQLTKEEKAVQARNKREKPLTLREVKPLFAEQMRFLLQILAHHAEKDRAPYRSLMDQVQIILAEFRSVAKSRDTREAKASGEGIPA